MQLPGILKKMAFWQLVPTQLFGYAVTMIPCALLVYFGAPATQGLLDMLAGKPLHILSVIGGILPANRYCHDHPYAEYKKRNLIFFTLGSSWKHTPAEYAGGINFCGNRCLLLWWI